MFKVEEIIILNTITEGFSRRAKHAFLQSFEEFMGEMYHFLDEVEQGYEMTIDDYTNDVMGRDLADELLEQLPPTTKKKVSELIKSWDTRFEAATNQIKDPLLSSNPNHAWYWYRLPKKLVGDLKEDVKNNKIK